MARQGEAQLPDGPPDEEAPPVPGAGGGTLSAVATIVAISLIGVYLVFLVFQWNNVEAAELAWARRSDVFGGLEALAFAAAGAILGTTVQRQVTKKAEEQTKQAEDRAGQEKVRADTHEQNARKGEALHNLALAKAGSPQTSGSTRVRGPGAISSGASSDVQEFLALAQTYDEGR
jgi:hypothetical protein